MGVSAYKYLSSLHSIPYEVLSCCAEEEVLDAMKRLDNQDDMAIFFTTTTCIGFGLQ